MSNINSTRQSSSGVKAFMDEDFLLQTDTAKVLYHEFAKQMPIIDYHCHLPPDEIAQDKIFENLTQIWLYGDHYKWRAMRSNGVDESYCTGNRSDREKFQKWAETVPYTLRNPLYHWTHLELRRYFDEYELLSPANADRIYDEISAKLNSPEYSVRSLLKKMDVRVVCTTDDPLDSLEYHQKIKEEGIDLKVLPTFRPDKFILIENSNYTEFIDRLADLTDIEIFYSDNLRDALRSRAYFFASDSGRLSYPVLVSISAIYSTLADDYKLFNSRLSYSLLSFYVIDLITSAI